MPTTGTPVRSVFTCATAGFAEPASQLMIAETSRPS